MRPRRLFVLACGAAVAVMCSGLSPAVAQSRASAEAELDRAGERLQIVTEEYNEARLRRQALDVKLAGAREDVERSEARLAAERKKLGMAVRDLYMHPAKGLEAFFQARTFGELERRRALGGQVALSADDLILKIRKAQAESRAASRRLSALRDDARRDEVAIASRQREAAAAYARTRVLLRQVDMRARNAARLASIEDAAEYAAENIKFAGPVRPSAMTAVRAAASQIGKPYRWGAAGPDAYDCSGLTMWAWARAGVSLPHSSRAQYASLPHVPMSQLAPGDLVFRGNPIHHVGIYKGGGVVIAAPHSGESVREGPVSGYTMAARP
jgi:cell wall-associated NlpC family hydrolase